MIKSEIEINVILNTEEELIYCEVEILIKGDLIKFPQQ